MVAVSNKLKIYILFFIGAFLALTFFFGGVCNAADDLLWQLMRPSKETENIIDLGTDVDTVGRRVIKGGFEVKADGEGLGAQNAPSIIVRATRLLLSLVVALSVTMILYNGMMYIIQTGQGKEAKDLTKNIAYIVIGIIISLFSVTIITLLQSVPKTLETELTDENQYDEQTLSDREKFGISWKSIGKAIGKLF